jgi:hypothetical protein
MLLSFVITTLVGAVVDRKRQRKSTYGNDAVNVVLRLLVAHCQKIDWVDSGGLVDKEPLNGEAGKKGRLCKGQTSGIWL